LVAEILSAKPTLLCECDGFEFEPGVLTKTNAKFMNYIISKTARLNIVPDATHSTIIGISKEDWEIEAEFPELDSLFTSQQQPKEPEQVLPILSNPPSPMGSVDSDSFDLDLIEASAEESNPPVKNEIPPEVDHDLTPTIHVRRSNRRKTYKPSAKADKVQVHESEMLSDEEPEDNSKNDEDWQGGGDDSDSGDGDGEERTALNSRGYKSTKGIPRKFRCDKCRNTYMEDYSLQNHIRHAHLGNSYLYGCKLLLTYSICVIVSVLVVCQVLNFERMDCIFSSFILFR